MKEIQIRQAVIEDLEQVAAVEARCFQQRQRMKKV